MHTVPIDRKRCVSFVVPAWNEAASLPRTLHALRAAADEVAADRTGARAFEYELLVVDDASTDDTAACARAAGADLLQVSLRHIAAVRNAGARHARGDVLIFVDADTIVTGTLLRAALRALDAGAVGGGAAVRFDGRMGLVARALLPGFLHVVRWFGCAPGCFLFVRRDAYERAGGFDEGWFAGEDLRFSRTLRRLGGFVILREAVLTSARKARLYGSGGLLLACLRMVLGGPSSWRRRERLPLWYEGRRERADSGGGGSGGGGGGGGGG